MQCANLRFARFTVVGHHQQDSSQASLTRVEELIYKIGLDSHGASQHKLEEIV